MVLGWRRPGRVGRCRIFFNNAERKLSSYKSHARQRRGKLILLSSVGSSERLLTARSLVRVQQGEPQKREHQWRCSFFVPSPLLAISPIPQSGTWCASCVATWRKRKLKAFLFIYILTFIMWYELFIITSLCARHSFAVQQGEDKTQSMYLMVSWGLGALICVAFVTQIWWMCKLCLQAYII